MGITVVSGEGRDMNMVVAVVVGKQDESGEYGMCLSEHMGLMNVKLAFHSEERIFITSGVWCSVCSEQCYMHVGAHDL